MEGKTRTSTWSSIVLVTLVIFIVVLVLVLVYFVDLHVLDNRLIALKVQ